MQTLGVLGMDMTGPIRSLAIHDPLTRLMVQIGTVASDGFRPVGMDACTIDASRFIKPVSFADAANATSAQLAAYDQSSGMALLSAAVEDRVKSIQSQLGINQYYRGGIRVIFPAGVIPMTAGATMFAGRVSYEGHATVFAKVGGDYGDLLHFRDAITSGGVYVKGNSELRGFSAIDLTATTHGALVITDNFEFGIVDNLRLFNGFENLLVTGCNNTKFSNLTSRSNEFLGNPANPGAGMVSGSSFLSMRLNYNGDNEFVNCTFAGENPSARYTQDSVLIQNADVATFIGGEYGCNARSTIHLAAVSGSPIQSVRALGTNLDNATKCQIYADGYTGTPIGSNCLFDCAFFSPDLNFINIANPAFYGATFRLNATGAPNEAIVCKGNSCTFEGRLRGVGVSATSDNQYSAIWMAGYVNNVRNMTIEGSASKSLAYAVEAGLGPYGQAVQACTFVPGGNAIAGVSYSDGSIYAGDVNVVGGAPVQATNSSAARTTPTMIS